MVFRLEMDLGDLLVRIRNPKIVWDDRVSYRCLEDFEMDLILSMVKGNDKDYKRVNSPRYFEEVFSGLDLPIGQRRKLLAGTIYGLQKFSESRDVRLQGYKGEDGRVLCVDYSLSDFKGELKLFRMLQRGQRNASCSRILVPAMTWLEQPGIMATYEEIEDLSRVSWLMKR